MTKKIILIRHTATNYNLDSKYCGITDVDLSAEGIKQAIKLRDYLKKLQLKVDKIFSSDLRRAVQCAKIIFNSDIELISGFREINFGLLEGLTHQEVMRGFPTIYKKWLKEPYKTDIPGGENFSDFKKRIEKALDKVLNKYKYNTVAIVTHAGPIRLILSNLSSAKDSFWNIILNPGAMNIFECDKDVLKPLVINDTSYLDEKGK